MKLLVIDIQKGITDSRLFNFEAFIDDTIRIIKAARDNQIEVIYFQHDDGPGTGFSIGDEDFEIAEQVIPKEGEKIFIKISIVVLEIKILRIMLKMIIH